MKLLIILGSIALIVFIILVLLCCLRASSDADDFAVQTERQTSNKAEEGVS